MSTAMVLALVVSMVGIAVPAMATSYLNPGTPSGEGVSPSVQRGFPGCADGLTAYKWKGTKTGEQVTPEGLTITVSRTAQPVKGDGNRYFDFTVDGGEIDQVIVVTEVFFIGFITESNVYTYPDAVSADTKLHPPTDWRDRPFKLDGIRFCYQPSVDISGRVFQDVNADGDDESGSDPALAGQDWAVSATDSANTETVAIPESDGAYSFNDLPSGSYEVCQVSPEGWNQSTPVDDGCYTVGANKSDADFGKYQNGSISGAVVVDANGDGELQPSETTAIEGATISANGSSAVSETDGSYTISELKPGTYDVCQTPPDGEGWVPSVPDGCHTGVSVDSGSALEGYDFGAFQQGSITGSRLINGEGFPGQTVRLLGVGGVLATTTTASDGSFEFNGLNPGQYTVCTTDIEDGTTPTGGESELCGDGEVGTDVTLSSGVAPAEVGFEDTIEGAEVLTCGTPMPVGGEGVSGTYLQTGCEGEKVVKFDTNPAADIAVDEVTITNVGDWAGGGYSLENWTFENVPVPPDDAWLYYDDGDGLFVTTFCLYDPRIYDGGSPTFALPDGLDTDLILPLNDQPGATLDRHTTCLISDQRSTVAQSAGTLEIQADVILFSIGDAVRGFR